MPEVVPSLPSDIVFRSIPTDDYMVWAKECLNHYIKHWFDEREIGSYHGVIYSRWSSNGSERAIYIYRTKTSIVVKYSKG